MVRSYAPARLRLLEQVYGDDIPWSAIAHGFACNGEKVLLANRAVGIFKPRQIGRGALFIKTTRPRAGRQNVYADAEDGHTGAEDGEGTLVYSLQGDDTDNHYHRSLRCACRTGSPSSISLPPPKASTRPSFPASSRASTCRR